MANDDEKSSDSAGPAPTWWAMLLLMAPLLAITGAAIYFTPSR